MGATAIDFTSTAYSLTCFPRKGRERFLMCAPVLYTVEYVINPWMEGNIEQASREVATEQWQRLYNAVSQVADVDLVEPRPGSPDMVFTANAGLVHRDQVAISSFFHPERQGEEPHFREWFAAKGYTIVDIPRETPFEGEGDALFSEDRSRLWSGFGPRTVKSGHQALRDAWGIEVISLELVDPRFYHLDTCFAPLNGGFVMYFPDAFSGAGLREIEAYYPAEKRILVEEADAVRFACNAVNVDQTIILNRVGKALSQTLAAHGFDVVEVELTEFMRAGGAAKCLVMKLGS